MSSLSSNNIIQIKLELDNQIKRCELPETFEELNNIIRIIFNKIINDSTAICISFLNCENVQVQLTNELIYKQAKQIIQINR